MTVERMAFAAMSPAWFRPATRPSHNAHRPGHRWGSLVPWSMSRGRRVLHVRAVFEDNRNDGGNGHETGGGVESYFVDVGFARASGGTAGEPSA